MAIFKAKMVMTKTMYSVTKNTPVKAAMEILLKHRLTGLPVIDDNNNVIGIVSEKDMLILLNSTNEKYETIEEVMSKNPVVFDVEDDLGDICDCLMNSSFRRVPILKEGKLAGIISRRDIMKFILKLRSKDR